MQLTTLGAPRVGTLPSAALDAITDVAGVRVGHCTLDDGVIQTGASVILPHADNLFLNKVPAAVDVVNGFGKSAGLMQVQELGTLETPIALVSTWSVGVASTALVRDSIQHNPELARQLPTVNPLVFECNDGYLNDAQALALQEHHVQQALDQARQTPMCHPVTQGSVGAGRGMSCHGLKGGIGTASRRVLWNHIPYTVGVLVLANQGRAQALTLAGRCLGPALQSRINTGSCPSATTERGSIIMLVAVDAPLSERQLRRMARRCSAGLARTGSDFGHGSGDIALAFSTAYQIPQHAYADMPAMAHLHESALDLFFQATAEATEQAILHALFSATGVTGRAQHQRHALREIAPDWLELWKTCP